MMENQENSEIITDTKSPIITTPKQVFPTNTNYGTCRFRHNEVIICKDVAFVVTFISSKKLSLKLLDKRIADELTGKNKITTPR